MNAMRRACVAVVLLALVGGWWPAGAQTGEGFDLTWSVIDNGGGTVAGSGFELAGAVGTFDGGSLAGSGYQLEGGFLTVAGVGSSCVGDCGGDLQVTVDELVAMVNIALGNLGIAECRAGDASGDSAITVDEILTAVNNALTGCG